MERENSVSIEADGARLAGYYYPAQGVRRAGLVLHGATGVPQRFYRHFARWAAERGIGVLTYDYRDFGESLAGHPKDSDVIFADWVLRDQGAAEAKLAELAPGGPLWILGHSLGGLGIPFRKVDPRVERIVTIGAGIGHFTDHPWSYRPKVIAFWFLFGPPATALAGYMPGRKLLLGADLPAGVYWQWRRWCTRRDFFRCDVGKSLPEPDFDPPVSRLRVLVAEDDVVVPPVAVKRYADAFAGGRADYRVLRPADHGLTSLKHIEILGKGRAAVWPTLLDLGTSDTVSEEVEHERA